MRLTAPRYKHFLWRQMRATWQVQSKKRKILDVGLKEKLEKRNMAVYDAMEIAEVPEPHKDELQLLQFPITSEPKGEESQETSKNLVHIFRDNNVLLEGLDQAKRLTNTVEPEPGVLPKSLASLVDAINVPDQDDFAKRCILSSIAFDAEQVKLPIRKNPLKRTWIFPRDYGISQSRRSRLLSSRLVQLCEVLSSGTFATSDRLIAKDARFCTTLNWDNKPVFLDVTADLLLLTSAAGLPPVAPATAFDDVASSDFPSFLSPLISIEEADATSCEPNRFPVKSSKRGPLVHTAFIHFDKEVVKNLYGTEVLPHQITGRSLMKAFAFSLAQARHMHGDKVQGDLPTPVTTQLVHTDGRWFHFAVMQLNTTNLHNTSVRNFFWSSPILEMYGPTSGYDDGRPVVHDYNSQVLKNLLAFYNNGS